MGKRLREWQGLIKDAERLLALRLGISRSRAQSLIWLRLHPKRAWGMSSDERAAELAAAVAAIVERAKWEERRAAPMREPEARPDPEAQRRAYARYRVTVLGAQAVAS